MTVVQWCTVADVEAVLDSTVDPARCNTLIDMASGLAQAYCAGRYPSSATVPPLGVNGPVATVVARAYSNPEGIKQETTGVYSYTRNNGSGGVTLTDEDKGALDDVLPSGVAGARCYTVITPSAIGTGYDEDPGVWLTSGVVAR